MLYQGSTMDEPLRDIPTDWIITDLAIAAHVYTGTPIYDGNSYEYQNTDLRSSSNTLTDSIYDGNSYEYQNTPSM